MLGLPPWLPDYSSHALFWTCGLVFTLQHSKLRQHNQGIGDLHVSGSIASADALKAEALNEQFNSVYTEEGSIPLPNLGESPYGEIDRLQISISGVLDQLNNINPSKAQGPDGIPPWFLNTYAAQLAPILHNIFQLSVDSRQVSEAWKNANVTAIFKKGSRTEAANYRPISLTSVASKLFEHIIHSHVYKFINYKFDIIAISETWVSEPEQNKFNINGYDVYHTARKNKRGGGVALYVKQELECKFLSYKSSVVDDLIECCTIEILLSGHRNIIVSCIYRCPGSNTDIFTEHILQLFFELTMRKTVFLCGDFNIDILKHKVDQGTKSFLDTMYSIGLYPLVDRPTRISNHSFSLIDNIFTNVTNHNVTSGILVSDITDHLPIFVFCTHPNPDRVDQKRNVKKRIINEKNIIIPLT